MTISERDPQGIPAGVPQAWHGGGPPKAHSIQVDWINVDDNSLREAAAMSGLDARFFDAIQGTKFRTMEKDGRKLIADRFIKEINKEWVGRKGERLSAVKCGVYVIKLGAGFEIDYGIFTSPVIYIGKGNIRQRITSHVRGKLFAFWRSILGVPFRFSFCAISEEEWCTDAAGICASLESHLIEAFGVRAGDELIAPLLNKNRGVAAPRYSRSLFSKGWDAPLKKSGRGMRTTDWLLRPSGRKQWKGELE